MQNHNKFWTFTEKNSLRIFFIIITILSIALRLYLIPYPSGEYELFLKPWFDNLKANGGLLGIGSDISNYNAPYITILALLTYIPVNSLITIKLFSIIFDYILAYAIYKLVLILFDKKKHAPVLAIIAYAITLFLPTIFLNSSYWAQADSVYSAFAVLAILYLTKEDYKKAFIFFGLSFAFKLQAIFILPLFILVYLNNRQIKLSYFLIVPLVNLITSFPAVIFGKSLSSIFGVYISQTKNYSQYISLNIPNFYSIFFGKTGDNLLDNPHESLITIGIIITIFIYIVIAFLSYYKKVTYTKEAIVEFALLSILIAVFFLPKMHDRYLYIADSLGFVYFLINRDKLYVPIIIELISLNGYLYLLYSSYTVNLSYLSVIYLVLLILITKDIFKKYLTT